MKSKTLRKQHIRAFAKLTLSERLAWTYKHRQLLVGFMGSSAKHTSKIIRRDGKKYFRSSNLA